MPLITNQLALTALQDTYTVEVAIDEATLQRATSPVDELRHGFDTVGGRDEWVKREASRVGNAYLIDGMFRQALDRHTELYRDIKLVGADKPTQYVHQRLTEIGLRVGEDWKTLLSRVVDGQTRIGNSFLLKQRAVPYPEARRPLYSNKPFVIQGLYLYPIERLEPQLDNLQRLRGWSVEGVPSDTNPLPNPGTIDSAAQRQAKITLPDSGVSRKNFLRPGLDIAHITYKRPDGCSYGVGIGITALEDLSLLRILEQSIAVMLKKDSRALIHHKITRPVHLLKGIQDEIQRAIQWHRTSPPGGVFVSGDNHVIDIKGSESRALRAEGYLDFYSARMLSALLVSPYIVGLKSGGLGAVEGALKVLNQHVRSMYGTLAWQLEWHILNELLWEGGFDPYSRPADQVKVEFIPLDLTDQLKEYSGLADSYTKGFLGLNEGRAKVTLDPALPKDLYLERVQIPLEQAKGAVAVAKSEATMARAPKAKPTKENLLPMLPTQLEDVDDFMAFLADAYNYSPVNAEAVKEAITALLDDDSSLIQFILEAVGGQAI